MKTVEFDRGATDAVWEEIDRYRRALEWIRNIADLPFEQDEKLRKRIANKCDEALEPKP